MREPANDKIRLEHILEACNMLIEGKAQYTLEEVKANAIKFYGFVKLVEIIGEATYKLTKEFRTEHPEVPWKVMEGMRHVLVHDYYHISVEKLWDTIEYDIPSIKPTIQSLINSLS